MRCRSGVSRPALFASIVVVACCAQVRASAGTVFEIRRADVAEYIGRVERVAGALETLEGELTTVRKDLCVIRVGGGEHRLRPGPGSRIFVNGYRACLEAARPVGPDAFFWAKAWFDRGGNLVALEAVYYGGELCACELSGRRLTGFSPELGVRLTLPLAEMCRPRLESGQAVYILLDLHGRVRSVYVLAAETEAKQEKTP